MTLKQPPTGLKGVFDWCVEAFVLGFLQVTQWATVKCGGWNDDLEAKAYLLRLKVKRRRAARAAVRERLRLEKLQRDRNLWS